MDINKTSCNSKGGLMAFINLTKDNIGEAYKSFLIRLDNAVKAKIFLCIFGKSM